MPADDLRPLVIAEKTMVTPEVCRFELAAPDGAPLPAFSPGSHIVVETPAGARRTYSLCGAPWDTRRWTLGVKREAQGRGGSRSLVDDTGICDELRASAPINRFALVPAPAYLLVAGGIGITPILAMARQLARDNADFRLVYCTRGPELTPFRDELAAFGARLTLHHDGGDPERLFDFWPLLETPGKAHVYCCGPAGLMEEVRAMTGHWPERAIHFEDFAGAEAHRPDDRAFVVRNARTGEAVEVPADATILEALRAAGHRMPSSCESGTCGSCRTRLVAGEPDHRDMVLRDDERLEAIMICVSRAAGGELVLEW